MRKKLFIVVALCALPLFAEQYRYQNYNGAPQAQGNAQTQAAAAAQAQQVAQPGQTGVFTEEEKALVNITPEKLMAMSPEERKRAIDAGAFDFKDEDAYIDVEDAVHYKQFVHRHLLSKAIADSEPVSVNRFFINLMTTSSYVHQQGDGINVKWVEFVTGGMAVSGGYALSGGHMLEFGANLSAISNVFGGYRYFLGTDMWTVWPYAGVGYGIAMPGLNISDGPDEVKFYRGKESLITGVIGILLPMPDVAVRVEVRSDFWGSNRIVVTPSFGLVLYM